MNITPRWAQISFPATMVALFVFMPIVAKGEVVVEWDFRTDANLSQATSGASTVGTLYGSAAVNTGANTGLDQPSYGDVIRSGSMTVPNNNTSAQGVSTTGGNGEWRDYMGTSTFGAGTAYIVFKPNFTYTTGGGLSNSAMLWSSVTYNSTQAINLQFTVEGDLVIKTDKTVQATIPQSAFSLDNDTWYFVAGSWEEGEVPTVYLRAITGSDTTAHFNASIDVTSTTNGPDNQPISVGYSTTFGSDYMVGAGDYALFRIEDSYTSDETSYDALYQSLIPEPSSMVIMGLTGLLLFKRRI